MARLRGRAPRGERCRAPVPHGHWKTTTFTGALRLSGMTEAERAIPIAEDPHRIAEASAEAADVAHALGRMRAEERDRRHAEAREARAAMKGDAGAEA